MVLSKEYVEFAEEFAHRRRGLYEKVCNFSEKILPISGGSGYDRKIQEAINFCHLSMTSRGAFAFTFLATVLLPVFLVILGLIFSILSVPYFVLIAVFTFSILYYFYNYPINLAISYRIKASSEMVLTILYMSIAMKVVPNIEYAVKFAGSNLTGPLARDLKKIMWDVYVGNFNSVAEALDPFIEKWKRESEEFTEAITLIKSAFIESTERRERMLDEAINTMLSRTKERMKRYSQDLKVPITVLNALGILLPLIGLIFFPLMSIFLPDVIQPVFLVIGYDLILPLTVYWLMSSSLKRRPTSFHQPEIPKDKFDNFVLLISVLVPAVMIGYSYYQISLSGAIFSFDLLLYSLIITWGASFGIIFYCIFTTLGKLKLREDIAKIESEMGEVLFQVGNQLTRGIPVENALKNALPRLKELKISSFIEKILYNMETFGMTFSSAVFDPNTGAINYYPSKLIAAVMKAVTEIAKGGMMVLSDAMISISQYLKNVNTVEEDLNEMLSEPASNMQMQALLLAPLSASIVIALTAMVMKIMVSFKEYLDGIKTQLDTMGLAGSMGNGFLSDIIKINQLIPVHVFQLIVGIYLIEVVSMVAIFLSIIKFGGESILRKYTLGKTLFLAVLIYSLVLIFVYSTFMAFMPAGGIIG